MTDYPRIEWGGGMYDLYIVFADHGAAITYQHGDDAHWYCEFCNEDPREGGECARRITAVYENLIHNVAVIVSLAAAAQAARQLLPDQPMSDRGGTVPP